MNTALDRELEVLFREPTLAAKPRYAAPLEVASGMLSACAAGQVTATTVVSALGHDDVEAFQLLAGDISEQHGLETRVRVYPGSYAVRFSRPASQS